YICGKLRPKESSPCNGTRRREGGRNITKFFLGSCSFLYMSPNDDKTICLTVQNLMLILYAEKKSSSVFHIFPLHRTSRMRKNNAFYPRLPSLFYCVLLHDVDSQLSYRT
ncbi:unnamed protein product, partial [Sphacelaria rigidula]